MKKETFSQRVKTEILENCRFAPCCTQVFVATSILSNSIIITDKGMGAEIVSGNFPFIKLLSTLITRLCGAECSVQSLQGSAREVYILRVTEQSLLFDCGILYRDTDGLTQIAQSPDKYSIAEDCCAKAYLKAAFLTGGSVNVPELAQLNADNVSKGYHIEFTAHNLVAAQTLIDTLARYSQHYKVVAKKEGYIVYAKECEVISNTLVLLGATQCMMTMENVRIERSLRNNANRQANCTFANIDKSVVAATKQIEAINKLIESGQMNQLDAKLRQIADIRLAMPDATVSELANKLAISKSGAMHRLRHLMQLAEQLT